MKTFRPDLIVAGALTGSTSLASAHQVDGTAGSSLFHYLTNPYHVAVFSVLAVVGVSCLVHYWRRTMSGQQD